MRHDHVTEAAAHSFEDVLSASQCTYDTCLEFNGPMRCIAWRSACKLCKDSGFLGSPPSTRSYVCLALSIPVSPPVV
eukprot:1593446-Amphidinium_carterae.1